MESTSATKAAGSNLEYTGLLYPRSPSRTRTSVLSGCCSSPFFRNVVNDSHGYDFRMLGIEVPSVSDRVRDFNQIIHSSHLPTKVEGAEPSAFPMVPH